MRRTIIAVTIVPTVALLALVGCKDNAQQAAPGSTPQQAATKQAPAQNGEVAPFSVGKRVPTGKAKLVQPTQQPITFEVTGADGSDLGGVPFVLTNPEGSREGGELDSDGQVHIDFE